MQQALVSIYYVIVRRGNRQDVRMTKKMWGAYSWTVGQNHHHKTQNAHSTLVAPTRKDDELVGQCQQVRTALRTAS